MGNLTGLSAILTASAVAVVTIQMLKSKCEMIENFTENLTDEQASEASEPSQIDELKEEVDELIQSEDNLMNQLMMTNKYENSIMAELQLLKAPLSTLSKGVSQDIRGDIHVVKHNPNETNISCMPFHVSTRGSDDLIAHTFCAQ